MNNQADHPKTLRLRDVSLFCISALLLLDTLSAGAAMGPSVIFWWLLLGLVFFVPIGLMTAELGCTFPEQGGIYAWVRDAFGERWAARVTWCYWINVAVWLPAVYILFAGIFAQLFMPDLGLTAQIVIGLSLTWATVAVNLLALDIGKWVPNIGALLKVVVFGVLIGGAVVYGLSHPPANTFSLETVTPRLGDSYQYVGVIIYGMMGFELICASADEMRNPTVDIPRGIFLSGLVVILAYVLATASILVVVPAGEVDLVEGLMDTLRLLLGESAAGRAAAFAIGVAALYTFFSNAVTWAMGCNRAAAEAAREGELPRLLAYRSPDSGAPVGAALTLGVACTVVLLLYGVMAGSNESLFWDLFAFSAVLFLLPYIGMCLAFLRLRSLYPRRPRPFRVPGGRGAAVLCTGVTVMILACSIALFCYVPGDGVQWSVFIGSLLMLALGEACIRWTESPEPLAAN